MGCHNKGCRDNKKSKSSECCCCPGPQGPPGPSGNPSSGAVIPYGSILSLLDIGFFGTAVGFGNASQMLLIGEEDLYAPISWRAPRDGVITSLYATFYSTGGVANGTITVDIYLSALNGSLPFTAIGVPVTLIVTGLPTGGNASDSSAPIAIPVVAGQSVALVVSSSGSTVVGDGSLSAGITFV